MKSKLLVILLLANCINMYAAVNVIPAPNFAQLTDETCNKRSLGVVRYVWNPNIPSEAYEINIYRNFSIVRYSDASGRFYADQTLAQLAEDDEVHCGVIKDAPRYGWRGLMLDEARHFFGKEKVKEVLDLMARYKLNRFHWHLSDNQGWRVEIKAYPQLCTIGAVGCFSDKKAPAKYYTQEDIREIVAYAAERHIEIIPEIDMPGHSHAFIKAFPDLDGGNRTVNPAKEELYVVLETIMKELASLFPGRYIHIGGDEVSTKGWRKCRDIPAFMKRENIKSYDDIQKYFDRRFSEIVCKTGKTVVAWDEVIDDGLSTENTLISWWRGNHPQVFRKCSEFGYKTIICSWKAFYLDYAQDSRCSYGQLASLGIFNQMKKLYDFNLPQDSCVVGIQANLWSEWIHTSKRLDYMLFPRAIALAEKAWSHEGNLNYDNFLDRLGKEYEYLDKMGIYYYDFRDFKAHPEPVK